jgi:hypothetical protein
MCAGDEAEVFGVFSPDEAHEVLDAELVGGEEALRLPWRFEPLHASFPLALRLVRIFGTVVQIAVLLVFHIGRDLASGRTIAPQLIGDNHPGHIRQAIEELPKECLRSDRVTMVLEQYIEDMAVLVDRMP